MLENPHSNILFDHVDGFEFIIVFWGQSLTYFPLLCEGATAEFLALGSSHNGHWHQLVIDPQPAYLLAESRLCREH